MIEPYDQLMGAAVALQRRSLNAEPKERRQLDIARRHALAAARILSHDQRVYDRITAMLERPVEGIGNPPCDACGTRSQRAEDMFTFRPDHLRYVCTLCVTKGYLAAVSS